MSRPAGLAAAVTSLALLGCGGASAPRQPDGEALFAESCARCHSLLGNESLRRQGGDLARYRLSRAELGQFVREMPLARPLAASELAAIVRYVFGQERSAHAR